MSFWLAVLIVAAVLMLVAWGSMFAIALVAAPRHITTGPTVSLARGLFLTGLGLLAIVIGAFILGVSTSWA